ncbi:MraY family glycosyltransferase [Thermosulfidibacter takaii]|uniref:MraY family glycosyltransferase n=1 Tax=Thermosulfidibacter takaii TaxID=412593 RepID=UPI000AE407EB|nr:glycosyltransferase [Thermosulfidibacter takaii]
MRFLLFTFLISFFLCFTFIKVGLFLDEQEGVQKFHEKPTPRVGGLAIYMSVILVAPLFFLVRKPFAKDLLLFLLSSFPVFLGGFLEDITRKVSPKWRLLGGFVSAILAFYLVSAKVTRVDVPSLDDLLKIEVFSILFTVFAFTGVAHAFNIIDGFNGLASGVAMLVFGAYAYISFWHKDMFLVYLNLLLVAAVLGFFLWNYPFGYIFLGDGGAYFLGFSAAAIGALIVNRHPDVSPWFPFLLVLYPVWETLFSAYRRKFLKSYPPHMPDALHFHQLIYRRLFRLIFGSGLD